MGTGKQSFISVGIYLILPLFLLTTYGDQDIPTEGVSYGTKHHSEITVLGYVTPWNTAGKDLVEEYRAKFDIVSPVWYTVHADESHADVYEVKGGPPSDEDREWYRRLQEESPSGLKALTIAPRFMLDGWSQADYHALLFNQTRWQLLSDSITEVVEEMQYDGAVFESGITHALAPPLSTLSTSLHEESKILIVVSPPIRPMTSSDASSVKDHNDMILQSIGPLAELADYLSIMTYDMSGPGGRESTKSFPDGSPMQAAQKQGRVREPGPNTSADWVRENLEAFILASDSTTSNSASFDDQQFHFKAQSTVSYLAGLPLYGYTYPVVYFDEHIGKFTKSRTSKDDMAMLQGLGEAITMIEIQRIINEKDPEIFESEEGEFFFDYTKEKGVWRTFMPTKESMTTAIASALELVRDEDSSSRGVGIALWEVGQSSRELLACL